MAEAIPSSIAETIIRQLGKTAVKEIALFWGVEDELGQLEGTISIIKSVLVYAEKQQLQDEQIRTWLERLEDVVYEADDLADEFSTEALRRQVMTRNSMAKQVRIFCSSSNRFAFRHKMGKKIRDLREKLDAIADDKKFHLEKGLQDTQVMIGEWKEHSFEREENIVGRNAEKIDIKKRLFDLKADHENIGIISIVGAGGLGKTTLAQLVINDGEVKDHFELIMWVNVPKVFDVELIVKEIVKSGEKDPGSIENIPVNRLQKDLQEKIRGKLYLLVLDDVWGIENREKWLKLENLLRDGAGGSRIIVTTRDEMVARIVNGRKESTYNLKTLNEEKAWFLFKKLAFVQGQEPNDHNLVEIGKEIMRKCGGIPLVIRTIGIATDDFLNLTKCKMHDCMHDLATSVTGTKGLFSEFE
nr:disease resistance protein RGA2-like [Ziziphus jujuba var. spinosa]